MFFFLLKQSWFLKILVLFQQSRMEERLDDAIYVLRHHAEPQQMGGHQGGMMQPSHSNGIMGYAPGGMSNTIEALVREIVI